MTAKPSSTGWTAGSRGDYVEGFHRGLEAFSGWVFPLRPGDEKVLRLLLSSSLGCDAVITAEAFQVQHGPRRWPTEYFPEAIPAVIQQLLNWSGAELPASEVCALLRSGDPRQSLPGWFVEPRLLWMRAEPEQIRLAVRNGTGKTEAELSTWPEPFPSLVRGQRRYQALQEPQPCPHCRAMAQHYRELIDGSLVCLTCHRSFASKTVLDV